MKFLKGFEYKFKELAEDESGFDLSWSEAIVWARERLTEFENGLTDTPLAEKFLEFVKEFAENESDMDLTPEEAVSWARDRLTELENKLDENE